MIRRRWGLLVIATVATGIAMRAAFLWWSPLPATLDGFRYARLATHVVGTNQILGAGLEADEIVLTLLLAVGSDLTGIRPLYLAQPLIACVGGASVLAGIVLVRSLGRTQNWSPRSTFHGSALAALALATSGMYLRRTGVPDEEAIALLLLPLFALASHRALASRHLGWTSIAMLLGLVYPPTHNMSALVAVFTLTGVVVIHVSAATTRRDLLRPVLAAGVFWAYFFGYFIVAEALGLPLTYSGLIQNHLGALVAWLIALIIGVLWVRSTTPNVIRTLFGVGVGVVFLVATANVVVPVFPGTIRTPPLVLGLVALYLIPVALVTWWLPFIVQDGGDTPAVIALLLCPLALVWFALSTSLTPEFFGTVMRVQVHAHIAVFVLAAGAVVSLVVTRPRVGRVAVAAFVLMAVVSAPLAFIHLDTGTASRTVHSSEFAAISVASGSGAYTSDHRLSRPGPLYYGDVSTSVKPTSGWLAGGPPPDCLTLAQQAWTTQGAHFFPTPPKTLDPERFQQWYQQGNLVYSVGGTTETYLVTPVGGRMTC